MRGRHSFGHGFDLQAKVICVICHHVQRVDFATHLGNWLCHKHCVVTHKNGSVRLQCHCNGTTKSSAIPNISNTQNPMSPQKVLVVI